MDWTEEPLWAPPVEAIIVSLRWDHRAGWSVAMMARREGEDWGGPVREFQSHLALPEALQLVDDFVVGTRGF